MDNAESTTRLGDYVKQVRIKKQLSYQQLADLTGLARNTVWKLEHGRINQPRPEALIALGRALSVPAADLYALADYTSLQPLPSFSAYLRARYQDLSPEQVAQLEGYFKALATQSGIDLDGPQPGEDEF